VQRIPPILAALVVLVPPPVPIPDPDLCTGGVGPCVPDIGIGPAPKELWERALDPIRDRRFPADLIDLDDWYLTLPTGEEGDPDDVHPPDLASFFDSDWFRLNDTRDGVVFRANAGGVTTENSNYPRSELREMRGGEHASWSNETGTHTMILRQAVTRLPEVKPHVVTAQIHGGDDDVMLVRLEGETLMAQYDDGAGEIVIDPAYRLGTPYDLRIVAADRRIEVFYNDGLAAEIPRSGSGWYFKTGSYVQSNPERGDSPHAVAEVVIYSLRVEHSE
jgi:Alginate lyase